MEGLVQVDIARLTASGHHREVAELVVAIEVALEPVGIGRAHEAVLEQARQASVVGEGSGSCVALRDRAPTQLVVGHIADVRHRAGGQAVRRRAKVAHALQVGTRILVADGGRFRVDYFDEAPRDVILEVRKVDAAPAVTSGFRDRESGLLHTPPSVVGSHPLVGVRRVFLPLPLRRPVADRIVVLATRCHDRTEPTEDVVAEAARLISRVRRRLDRPCITIRGEVKARS